MLESAAYTAAVGQLGGVDSGNAVASGVYLYRLRQGSEIATRKMIFLRYKHTCLITPAQTLSLSSAADRNPRLNGACTDRNIGWAKVGLM